ncbi:MAG: AAA family ATPase [Stigonema ocellatum SAG 48.90 = DSM 106950]|nr:AAA family ATPase [Stigonema ocellatum SAG 48.90 = DSM 106950]
MSFHHPVTFFVGENGSGKSTMLEAIAAGVGSITVGGEDIQLDKTLHYCYPFSNPHGFS